MGTLPPPWFESPRLYLQATSSPPPPGVGSSWSLEVEPLSSCLGSLPLLSPTRQEDHAVRTGHLSGTAFLQRFHARFAPQHPTDSPPRFRRGLPPGLEALTPGRLRGRLYDPPPGHTHRTLSLSPERPDRLLSNVSEEKTWAGRSLRAWAGCYLMDAGWKVDFGRTLTGDSPSVPPWSAECAGEILHFHAVPTPSRFFHAPLVNFDLAGLRYTLAYPRPEDA